MQTCLTEPLNDAELDRLDEFLCHVNPGEAMSLEELDGYFCALICCPDVVPPSEYLPHVWGEQHVGNGAFKSVEDAQEVLTLFSRHWNTIAATLYRDEPYPVLMGEYHDGKITGQEWAIGFQKGMLLRRKPWERLLKDEKLGAALLPILVLAEDDDHHLVSESVTQNDRDTALDLLADVVLMTYRYFRSEIKPQGGAKKRSASQKRSATKKHAQ
jgi:uncharacterized protein